MTNIDLSPDTEHLDGIGSICCKSAVFVKTPTDEGAHHVVAHMDAGLVVFKDKKVHALKDKITDKVNGKLCTR